MSEPFRLTIEQRAELRRIFVTEIAGCEMPVLLDIKPRPCDAMFQSDVAVGRPISMSWHTFMDDGLLMRASLDVAVHQDHALAWEMCKMNALNLARQARFAIDKALRAA